MKTLHIAYRITELKRSLAFYTTLGYTDVGRVDIGNGTMLLFLKFPDDPFVTLELVYRSDGNPIEIGNGFDHLVVQVDEIAETLADLTRKGLKPGSLQFPGGPDGPKTAWLNDPDGYPIELVEWPAGHADGLTEADFS